MIENIPPAGWLAIAFVVPALLAWVAIGKRPLI